MGVVWCGGAYMACSAERNRSKLHTIHHSAPQQIALQHNTSSPRPSESTSGGRGPTSTFLYCARALDSSLSFLSSRFASTRTDILRDNRGHDFDPESLPAPTPIHLLVTAGPRFCLPCHSPPSGDGKLRLDPTTGTSLWQSQASACTVTTPFRRLYPSAFA